MYFRKAFDTVSHPMLGAFLHQAGLPEQWVPGIMSLLKGRIGFLMGKEVSPEWIRPGGGIRQGVTLSPALFALLSALLCRKLQQQIPQARPFLYADDTLVWNEDNPTKVQAAVKKLKEIMQEYGDYTAQRLIVAKCAAILQGDWGPLPITSIEGGTICTLPRMAPREYDSVQPVRSNPPQV